MYSTSVNVFVEDLDKNPYCFHGPSLLFKTISPNVKEYFACSAYRDRKDCSFYLNAADKDDQKQKEGQKKWEAIHQEIICNIHNEKRYDKFVKIMNSLKSTNMIQCTEMDKISLDKIKAFDTYSDLDFNKSKKRKRLKDASKNLDIGYCQTCKVLVKNKNSEHIVCEVVRNLTAHQLMHPTEILKPKENSKAEAQYFFKSEVVEKIVSIILKMNVSRILCIGTPRIHEYVLNKLKGKLESMLLDIDQSYYNFYDSKQFIWYNMFNNYMFDKKCHSDLLNFLKTKKLLILMDPPFGGRVEPLANTLKALNKSYVEVNRIKDNGWQRGKSMSLNRVKVTKNAEVVAEVVSIGLFVFI